MAATSAASSSSEDDGKEELDFLSPNFNPSKALFSPDVKVPFENVKSFSSLSSYETAIKVKNAKPKSQGAQGQTNPKLGSHEKVSTNKSKHTHGDRHVPTSSALIKKEKEIATTSKTHSSFVEKSLLKKPVERPGTHHAPGVVGNQGGRGKVPLEKRLNTGEALRSYLSGSCEYDKYKRNVLTRMGQMCGPLELLARCVKDQLHVRVMTRAAVHVKSICRGYVVAFDKTFNIALIDVDEIFRRPACLGKIRARRTHKLQAAQKTLTKERDEQRERFISSNPWAAETPIRVKGQKGNATSVQFTKIKNTTELEQTGIEKKGGSAGLTKTVHRKSVYDDVPVPFSNYEREALMLGIPDENVDHRHMNQVFIRGENVVLVSVIDD